jgi:lysophospholipase L1-like esterase
VFFAAGIVACVTNIPRIVHWYLRTKYDRHVSFFAANPVKAQDIVFLGDSITREFPWQEHLVNLTIKNRGISGDTTAGVLRRLRQVTLGRPRKIFLLIGTNDLGIRRRHADVIADYERILAQIVEESPETIVYVQSILPRQARFAHRVRALNRDIASLADKYEYPFIDLFSAFADEHGQIKRVYSNDLLHLINAGYVHWLSLIQAYVLEG